MALLTNLGLSYYQQGYFSNAIDAWTKVWREYRGLSEPKTRALVDRSLGELVRMHARLGHQAQLKQLLAELGNRSLTGPATEALTGAREGLAIMQQEPEIAYLCGPMALKSLLKTERLPFQQFQFLDEVHSGTHGVSMSRLSELADKAQFPHRLILRRPDQPIPVPSIVHWKLSHFAAITGREGSRFHVEDPTFGQDLWITEDAIDSEASGYFLVSTKLPENAWRRVNRSEASKIVGMGYTSSNDARATKPSDDRAIATCPANSGTCGCGKAFGMCGYNIIEMVVSLNLTDTPVGYAPPKGPPVFVTLTYNQREASQPAAFAWSNVSPKWTTNWQTYIEDAPSAPGALVRRVVAGGGSVDYTGYSAATGAFSPEAADSAILVRTSADPITYERRLADGGREVYAQSNGATTQPRRIFLTEVIDRAGNAVSLQYDGLLRLLSLTDATGRVTTFSYEIPSQPLLITKITDPFGRFATLHYDDIGRLDSITDVIGITSQFTYDNANLVKALTTPYGTSHFEYGQQDTMRWVNATDPLGHTERVEFQHLVKEIPNASVPRELLPVGIVNPYNTNLYYRNTFYWDKHAFALAPTDHLQARIKHWNHLDTNGLVTANTWESIKFPFENRVWFNYPGQLGWATYSGSMEQPSRIGRVLDDGSTQLTRLTYNDTGHVTDMIDPVGRETQLTYAPNGIDLIKVEQKTSASGFSTIAQFTYNSQHLPLTYTDAAGQTTKFEYNAAGQLTQLTNALNETTSFQYDGFGYLTTITNANGQTQASFTYNQYGDIATATDSEGYVVAYDYDAFDRITQATFPDSTTRKYNYTNLDLTSITDRQGNTTQYAYGAVRNLISTTDPLQRTTRLGYWENQSLKSLTDANGNTTGWTIDVQNRVTGKQYADGTQVMNAYENTTSRLKSITDALGQVKTFTYGNDDTLTNIAYTRSINPTPNVSFAYDPYFRRITSMTDGNGTRNYAYQTIGAPGALQLAREAGPFTNDAIAYAYDPLSRLASRTVDSNTESFAYDKLSRLITHGTALGIFNLGYLGQTEQLTSQQISTGTVGTTWQYDTNTNDRRLKAINNSGATRSFSFTTTPESLITQIQETAPQGSAWAPKTWNYNYDDAYRLTQASSGAGAYGYSLDSTDNITSLQSPGGTTSASYSSLNQIVNFGSNAYAYDKNGNVLDDGLRTYTWDAENRLLSITSRSNAALKTVFKYDGLGRRTAIDTGSNAAIETRYLWCGEQLCQARTSADAVQRRYYSEGEYLPLGGTSLYYSQDQLGSVRDVLATQNGSRVASFDYESYGKPSQSNGRVATDFRYGGLFYDQEDGLHLALYRIFDSAIGRWLSRDPIDSSALHNLYTYSDASPITKTDKLGLYGEWECAKLGICDEAPPVILDLNLGCLARCVVGDEISGLPQDTLEKIIEKYGVHNFNLKPLFRQCLGTGLKWFGRFSKLQTVYGIGKCAYECTNANDEVLPRSTYIPSNNYGEPGGCGQPDCLIYLK
jgi:RHS repeat-associated protein